TLRGEEKGDAVRLTPVSLPPQTAAELEVGRTPAADAGLVSDLLGETARRARVPVDDHASLLDLDSIERAFGRHLFDPRARSGIQAARARADRLAEGAYGPC